MFSKIELAPGACFRTLAIIGLVGFPLMLGLAAVADPFVRVLYGTKWLGLIPLLRVLAVVGALQLLTNPTGWIFVSHGRTDLMFRWGLGACTAIIIAIAFGAYAGSALSVATAYFIIIAILVPPCLALAGSVIGASLREIWWAISGPALCALAMAAAVAAIDWSIRERVLAWVRLGVDVLAGAGLYAGLVRATKVDAFRELLQHIRNRSRPAAEAQQDSADVALTKPLE